MRVWLIKIEDPLPIDPFPRLHRMGMLADALLEAGHEVVWWASTFDHYNSRLRYNSDKVIDVNVCFQIRLLHTVSGYSRTVSVKRALNGYWQAFRLYNSAFLAPKPNIIFCATPTPEMARISVALGKVYGIPVFLDARDMWPDIFVEVVSPLKRMIIAPYIVIVRMILRSAARNATGCIGITEFFLDWILGYADRPRSEIDRVFPLGYAEPVINAVAWADAEKTLTNKVSGLENRKTFNILFLGRLNRAVLNVFDLILDAAAVRLRKDSQPFQFWFAGAGDCTGELRERARKHSEIVFLGHINSPKMAVLKSRAHATLLCIARRRDYQESLPNKVFEYLSAGLPIVSHLTGLSGELVTKEECGFVYNNSEELAAGLRWLAKDESVRKAMGTKARKVFQERFDACRIYPKMVDHLEYVVKMANEKKRCGA